MRNLDDGGGGDDANSEAFGDGKLDAVSGGEVDIEEEGFVAGLAEDRDAEVVDGSGEVVRDGLESTAKGIHLEICVRLCLEK